MQPYQHGQRTTHAILSGYSMTPQSTSVPYPQPSVQTQRPSEHRAPTSDLIQAISRMFTHTEENSNTRMDYFQSQLNRIVEFAAEGRKQTQDVEKRVIESHDKLIHGLQVVLNKVNDSERILGPLLVNPNGKSKSIVGRLSEIEMAVQEISERLSDPEANKSVVAPTICHSVGTSPHMPSVDLPAKEYADAGVGFSAPTPVLVSHSTSPQQTYRDASIEPIQPLSMSRSTNTELGPMKTYRDMNVGYTTVLTPSSSQQSKIDVHPSDVAATLPPSKGLLYKSRFDHSSYLPEHLVPASWTQAQGGSSDGTFSSNTSAHGGPSRQGSIVGTMDELRAHILNKKLNPDPPVKQYEEIQTSLPSPPVTTGAPSTSPELNNFALPEEDPEDYARATIDTAVIFANDPAYSSKRSQTPEATDVDLDYGPMSPLSSLDDFEVEQLAFQKSVSVNPLKRKKTALGHDSASAPPPKRSRGKDKVPRRRKSVRRTGKTVWPALIDGDETEYVQCDTCLSWYHKRCVGIVEGDLEGIVFECPPCAVKAHPLTSIAEGQTRPCMRPGCKPKVDEYFVEEIVGRRLADSGDAYEWLVKWDGWPMNTSTWEPTTNIGSADKFIEGFRAKALKESLNIEDDEQDMLLLRCSKTLGYLWKRD